MTRKEAKLQVLTNRHNSLVCRCLQQQRSIEELTRQLRSYQASEFDRLDGKLKKSKSLGVVPITSPDAEGRRRSSFRTQPSLKLLPEYKGQLVPLEKYDLAAFTPVNPEDIYLKLYALEKEIKKHEPDSYFRVKEFALKDDPDISYYDIARFAEELAHQMYHKGKIDESYLRQGEADLQEKIEELCFEVMYHKLFGEYSAAQEARNAKLQERIFILQNLVSPGLVGIKEKHYAFNVYQLAFAGRRRSPRAQEDQLGQESGQQVPRGDREHQLLER